MHRTIIYTLLFLTVALLQVFLFNNLDLSIYVCPLVYLAFIALLPLRTTGALLMILAFAMGALMDLGMATAGVNTIASLASAFVRQPMLSLIMGKEEARDEGAPVPGRMGRVKWIRYILLLTFIHCLVFFSFESLTWSYYYLTLARIVLSTAATALCIWFIQLLFALKR